MILFFIQAKIIRKILRLLRCEKRQFRLFFPIFDTAFHSVIFYMKHFILTLLVLIFSCFSCRNGDQEKPVSVAKQELSPERKQAYDSLLMQLEQLKKDRLLEGATLGYLIIDCTDKDPLLVADYNPTQPLIPASTLKIFVTGAALELLGPQIIPEVTITNQMSVNWRSSKLLRKIGGKVYDKNTTTAGAKAIMEFWKTKGIDTENMTFDDGNGLSRNNAISPKQLVDALYAMERSRYFKAFYESLPLAGLTGTLRKAMKDTPAQGRIRAKTGTIAGVKSFAGYVHTLSGQRFIFAIIVNNFYCRAKKIKKKLEQVMVKMAEI